MEIVKPFLSAILLCLLLANVSPAHAYDSFDVGTFSGKDDDYGKSSPFGGNNGNHGPSNGNHNGGHDDWDDDGDWHHGHGNGHEHHGNGHGYGHDHHGHHGHGHGHHGHHGHGHGHGHHGHHDDCEIPIDGGALLVLFAGAAVAVVTMLRFSGHLHFA